MLWSGIQAKDSATLLFALDILLQRLLARNGMMEWEGPGSITSWVRLLIVYTSIVELDELCCSFDLCQSLPNGSENLVYITPLLIYCAYSHMPGDRISLANRLESKLTLYGNTCLRS